MVNSEAIHCFSNSFLFHAPQALPGRITLLSGACPLGGSAGFGSAYTRGYPMLCPSGALLR